MFRNPLIDALVVLVVVVLFFGPKRLPELGKGLGEGIRGFKDSIGGGDKSADDKPALTAEGTAVPTTTRDTADSGPERSS